MPSDKTVREAIKVGQAAADDVIAYRQKALRRRSRALAEHAARVSAAGPGPAAAVPVPAPIAAAAATAGVLVAEGDSWFDYPWTDVLGVLEDDHGYDVESVAHKGDRVEEMAYGGGQLEELSRRIEKLLRNGQAPAAILLSGGGNDIAGTEFGMLLNHASSPIAGWNSSIVDGVVDQRIRVAYIAILAAITRISQQWLPEPLPILVHGYDYPVPDGRGFLGGWAFLPGPWLQPGFREKGFDKLAECTALMKKLIDRFNKMLAGVCAQPQFQHVHYVDLRGTLSPAGDYKRFWANELHPTAKGFGLVAERFVKKLQAV